MDTMPLSFFKTGCGSSDVTIPNYYTHLLQLSSVLIILSAVFTTSLTKLQDLLKYQSIKTTFFPHFTRYTMAESNTMPTFESMALLPHEYARYNIVRYNSDTSSGPPAAAISVLLESLIVKEDDLSYAIPLFRYGPAA